MSTENRKAVRDSNIFWQLDGESELYAATIPDPPKADVAIVVRLTHSNSYGPFDDAEFFVRVGDPDKPTDQAAVDSATDWVQARLVEELVIFGDEEMLRSERKSRSRTRHRGRALTRHSWLFPLDGIPSRSRLSASIQSCSDHWC